MNEEITERLHNIINEDFDNAIVEMHEFASRHNCYSVSMSKQDGTRISLNRVRGAIRLTIRY